MTPIEYFNTRSSTLHKQYDAMKAYFVDQLPAADVAKLFGYSVSTVYSMARDLRKALSANLEADPFFKPVELGRKRLALVDEIKDEIVSLRKSFLSIPEIKAILDSKGKSIALTMIGDVLKREGFARLPRRDKETRGPIAILNASKMMADKTSPLSFGPETFSAQYAGLLRFIPIISRY